LIKIVAVDVVDFLPKAIKTKTYRYIDLSKRVCWRAREFSGKLKRMTGISEQVHLFTMFVDLLCPTISFFSASPRVLMIVNGFVLINQYVGSYFHRRSLHVGARLGSPKCASLRFGRFRTRRRKWNRTWIVLVGYGADTGSGRRNSWCR
jgi:hypothetical protein